jgi:acyl carrier protein
MTIDQIEARLLGLIATNYETTMDGGDLLSQALGLDSLEMVSFLMDVEELWPAIEDKIDLDDDIMAGTPHELAKAIHRVVGGQA